MKIEINFTKSHLYLILAIVILLIATFVIGQSSPDDFGHRYEELVLRDSQGIGLISGNDIAKDAINAENIKKSGPYVELSVLSAKNADAASCEFIIKSCSTGGNTGKTCSPGFGPVPGEFGFTSVGRDKDYTGLGPAGECIGSGIMGLCCKTP